MSRVGIRWWQPLLLLAPLALLLSVLRVLPTIESVYYGFTKWSGINEPQFIGLRNYEVLFSDPNFRDSVIHLVLIVLTLPIWVITPLLIAAMLYERPRGWRIYRTILFLPAAISPVVIGLTFEALLRANGPVNTMLRAVGLGDLARGWLADTHTALPVVIVILIWASLGVGVMIFVAAMGQVNPDLFDAASIDGASWLQRQRYVTVPSLIPVIQFYSAITVIGILTGLFTYIFVLTQGGPGYATIVPEYYVYVKGFQQGAFGYANAVAVVLLIAVAVLVAMLLRTFKVGDSE